MQKLIPVLCVVVYLIACQPKAEISDAYGNFEASATVISAESPGKILFLNVEEGQEIEAGVLVAIIDTTQLDLQRNQIQASINTLPKKLRNTLADIEVLKDQQANLVRERDRVQRLLDKKAATPKQLDDLNGNIQVVEKQIEAIRSQTQTGNRAILAEKEPLIAQIAIINEQIRKAYVYNPIRGTILTKLAEPFEIVGVGMPLYRIGQLDTMTLRFYADAVQIQDVRLGQQIQVLVDQGDAGFEETIGKINWISDEAEFTPKTIQTKEDRVNLVYAIKADVSNPQGLLKMGMPAEINFSKKSTDESEK